MTPNEEPVYFSLSLSNALPPIRMRIYRRADHHLIVEQSHFLKTSIQYLPYAVREMEGDDPGAAFQELTAILRGFYEQALRRGYTPSAAWLVPNTSYKDEVEKSA